MKVSSLHVSNLLSFYNFNLTFQDGLTVIVGANGSGKTNAIKVLELITKLLEWSDNAGRLNRTSRTLTEDFLASYAQASHDNTPPNTPITIELGLEFTTDVEKKRIVSFLKAAVLIDLLDDLPTLRMIDKTRLVEWVSNEISENKLESLFTGTLIFSHTGLTNAQWESRYRFKFTNDDSEFAYDWILLSSAFHYSLVSANSEEISDISIHPTTVKEAIFGDTSPAPGESWLPDPLPKFSLGMLCLPVEQKLANFSIQTNTESYYKQYEPIREASKYLDLPSPGVMGQSTYGFARALNLNIREGLVIVGEQFRGIGMEKVIHQSASTDNNAESDADQFHPHDPAFLPLRLFQLKNGATPKERKAFADIQELFTQLAPGRHFDISMTIGEPFLSSATSIRVGQVQLTPSECSESSSASRGQIVSIVAWNEKDKEPLRERPIQVFGAGTWEALVLAEALISPDESLIALDEPGATFHPTWQNVLTKKLERQNRQCLLITHSPNLVPMNTERDLCSLVHFSIKEKATQTHRLPENLENERVAKITRQFAHSAEARALLFCRGAILVEGGTEFGALPIWFENSKTAKAPIERGGPIEHNFAFYDVQGDTNFGNLVTVLECFGIPWVIVCDGAVFDFGKKGGNHIFKQILNAGVDAPGLKKFVGGLRSAREKKPVMDSPSWKEQLCLAKEHGIYTLASGWTRDCDSGSKNGGNESFESFVEKACPGELENACCEVGESKPRQGRWVANKMDCPDEVDKLYAEIVDKLLVQ